MEKLDLSALDTKKGAEQGFEVQLTHPNTGTVIPVWIKVLGIDSDTYRATLMAQQRRRMERLRRGKRMNVTPEELEDEALDLLVTITISWRADMTLDGKPYPEYSTSAAKSLYQRFPWIREQVDSAMADRANFLPGSEKA
jgi:hypothetical protein